MARIRFITGGRKGEVLPLDGDRFVFGRDAQCEFVLDSREVSRRHACIYRSQEGWRIQDLGSINHSLVNDAEVQDGFLRPKDRILLGDVEMAFEDEEMPKPPSRPKPTREETPAPFDATQLEERVKQASRQARQIQKEISKVIIGQHEIIQQLLTAILSSGHVLMIGMPGLAKTLLIRTVSDVLDLQFHRIQFTPDLMPSDVTGTEILEVNESNHHKEYRFIQGPIFTNILLADEINRTPPKTQAALLEAMQEQRVTAGGQTHQLILPFFVLATQNPLEQEGTYPLPEAQLDRFMFSICIGYPKEEEEETIAKVTTTQRRVELQKMMNGPEILELQAVIRNLPIADHVVKYATRLVRATRPGDPRATDFVKKWIHCGAGPRATQYLVVAAKARAVLEGRLLVASDDIRAMAQPVLRHRMFTNFTADSEGVDADQIVQKLLKAVPEPGEKDYEKAN